MFKKTNIIFLIIITFLFFSSTSVLAYGVNPLNISLRGVPGNKIPFEIKLTPSGREETVNLNLYNASQKIDGSLKFIERQNNNENVLNWINFEEAKLIIPPDSEVIIEGTVNIPYDAAGSYTAIMMVEPERKEGQIGIIMHVRYAVRIDIFVDKPGLRARGEITDIGLKGDQEMNPVVYAKIKNISNINLAAASEVTIRSENRRLLERVELRSPATARSGRDYLVIYRDSEVRFEGNITEPLPAGNYDLRIFLRYNNGRQIIRKKKLTIDNEYFHPERINYLEISPLNINENLRPGGAIAEGIKLRNRVDEDLIVKIASQEIESDYPMSVFSDFSFELRGEAKFKLTGRRETRQILIIRAPRDIEAGGYYGKIAVQVYNLEEDELLETHHIPLNVIVGSPQNLTVDVKNLNVIVENQKILFSITTTNKSKMHVKPTAVLNLKKGDEVLRSYSLNLTEGVNRILPLHSAVMFTEVNIENIDAGEYQAEVTIYENDNILLQKELEVLVPIEEVKGQ